MSREEKFEGCGWVPLGALVPPVAPRQGRGGRLGVPAARPRPEPGSRAVSSGCLLARARSGAWLLPPPPPPPTPPPPPVASHTHTITHTHLKHTHTPKKNLFPKCEESYFVKSVPLCEAAFIRAVPCVLSILLAASPVWEEGRRREGKGREAGEGRAVIPSSAAAARRPS